MLRMNRQTVFNKSSLLGCGAVAAFLLLFGREWVVGLIVLASGVGGVVAAGVVVGCRAAADTMRDARAHGWDWPRAEWPPAPRWRLDLAVVRATHSVVVAAVRMVHPG